MRPGVATRQSGKWAVALGAREVDVATPFVWPNALAISPLE
jgi:hypothetical protein